MDDRREAEITQVFVALASSLARGVDVLDMLSGLATDCARLLDVTSAGLLLADGRGVLHVVAASSERTRNLEIFQLQRDQGPCLDCYRQGHQVIAENLPREARRWPQFAGAALNLGFASVHALPLHLGERTLGTLGLFGAEPGALNAGDLRLGQAFADVASVALVQGAALSEQETLNRQLQGALDSRVVVEQAKGILSQVGDVDMEEAFTYLRRYSRDHNQRLSEVAGGLVSRRVTATAVVEHAKSKLSRR